MSVDEGIRMKRGRIRLEAISGLHHKKVCVAARALSRHQFVSMVNSSCIHCHDIDTGCNRHRARSCE